MTAASRDVFRLGRDDVIVVAANAETQRSFDHYASKGWVSTRNIKVSFVHPSPPKGLPAWIAVTLDRGSRCVGYVANAVLHRPAVCRPTVSNYLYVVVHGDMSPAPLLAYATAAAAEEEFKVLLVDGDDDDVVMQPAPPPPRAVVVSRQQQQQQHASFSAQLYLEDLEPTYEVNQQQAERILGKRLELLLHVGQLHKFAESDLAYLLSDVAVFWDRLSLQMARLAMSQQRQRGNVELADKWQQAERALFRARVEFGYRTSQNTAEFASRFLEHALPLGSYEQPSDEDKRAFSSDSEEPWVGVPFEHALSLVARRRCLLLGGIAHFPVSLAAIVDTALPRFTREVLRIDAHGPAHRDARTRGLLAGFRGHLSAAFDVGSAGSGAAAPADFKVKHVKQLQFEIHGAPKCIQGLIKALVEKKEKPYLKHAARLAVGSYLRARGVVQHSDGVNALFERGMFAGQPEGALKATMLDMFPAKDKRNYAVGCGVLQKAGLCPFGDNGGAQCAASVGMIKILHKPLDYTQAFFERTAKLKAVAAST